MRAVVGRRRLQDFAPEDIAGDRLAHGYAVTVHRSQGLTVDATHGLDDGGGRELAYVRMSRARTKTMIYATADDVEMAAEDLARSWSNETRQRWAIDRLPGDTRALTPVEPAAPAVRLARLRSEAEHLAGLIPAVPANFERVLADAERRRDSLRYRLEALDREHSDGEWAGTPVGDALRAWKSVHYEHNTAEQGSHDAPLLRRPGFARQARDAARREAPLEAAYRDLAATARQELLPQLSEATKAAADLDETVLAHRRFMRIDHPEVPRRLGWLSGRWESSTARCPSPAPSWRRPSAPNGPSTTPAGPNHRRAAKRWWASPSLSTSETP